MEQKALSSLQNCVHVYIHNRHDRSFRELFSVYADVLQTFAPTQAIHDYVIELSLVSNLQKISSRIKLFSVISHTLEGLEGMHFTLMIPRAKTG